MEKVKITTYRLNSGEIVHVGSDGFQYELDNSLSGLGFGPSIEVIQAAEEKKGFLQQGGFLDRLVKTASGVFKKKDGSNTYIGDTLQQFVNSAGAKLGSQVGVVVPTPGQDNPYDLSFPQSNLPYRPDPPEKADNTIYWVGGMIGALLLGIGVHKVMQKSS